MSPSLSSLLWGLSKSTVQKASEHRQSGTIVLTPALYVRSRVKEFHYDQGQIGHHMSFENVERQEWDTRDRLQFIENVVKRLPEYSSCVGELAAKYKVAGDQAEVWLFRFVQVLVARAVEPPSDEFLIEQVNMFIGDLEGAAVDWKAVVWLEGIWLEDERYDLPSQMVLRQPSPVDLETERDFALVLAGVPPTSPEIGSAVLEFSFRGKDAAGVQTEIGLIVDVLRLFRLGSVTATKSAITPVSILRSGYSSHPSRSRGAVYRYAFHSADVSSFGSFTERVRPFLASYCAQGVAGGDAEPLQIALERYREALLDTPSVEARITSAITCLEALYLKGRERLELSHRLGQRASALLRLVGCVPLQVYNNVAQAYEIRSTFIHGSQIEKERRQSASKLCDSIMEYARLSLLVFLQMQQTLEKEKLINRLDNSLLDEKARGLVDELVRKEVISPK